jgi:hypothetical protein
MLHDDDLLEMVLCWTMDHYCRHSDEVEKDHPIVLVVDNDDHDHVAAVVVVVDVDDLKEKHGTWTLLEG